VSESSPEQEAPAVQALAQQLKKWFADPVESVFAQVPRALVASGLAAVIDLALLVLLVESFGWHPAPASVLAYLAGGVLQYVLCSLWVFPNAPKNAATGFLAFTILSLVGLAITWLTMVALFDWGRVHYGLAKVVALGLAFSWNFASRKYLLFRTEDKGELLPE
jgi:putative flippase GtrA